MLGLDFHLTGVSKRVLGGILGASGAGPGNNLGWSPTTNNNMQFTKTTCKRSLLRGSVCNIRIELTPLGGGGSLSPTLLNFIKKTLSIYKKSDMVPMFRMAFSLASGRTRAAGRADCGIPP